MIDLNPNDCSDQLQQRIDGAKAGEVISDLPQGTFLCAKPVYLDRNGITIDNPGLTLQATGWFSPLLPAIKRVPWTPGQTYLALPGSPFEVGPDTNRWPGVRQLTLSLSVQHNQPRWTDSTILGAYDEFGLPSPFAISARADGRFRFDFQTSDGLCHSFNVIYDVNTPLQVLSISIDFDTATISATVNGSPGVLELMWLNTFTPGMKFAPSWTGQFFIGRGWETKDITPNKQNDFTVRGLVLAQHDTIFAVLNGTMWGGLNGTWGYGIVIPNPDPNNGGTENTVDRIAVRNVTLASQYGAYGHAMSLGPCWSSRFEHLVLRGGAVGLGTVKESTAYPVDLHDITTEYTSDFGIRLCNSRIDADRIQTKYYGRATMILEACRGELSRMFATDGTDGIVCERGIAVHNPNGPMTFNGVEINHEGVGPSRDYFFASIGKYCGGDTVITLNDFTTGNLAAGLPYVRLETLRGTGGLPLPIDQAGRLHVTANNSFVKYRTGQNPTAMVDSPLCQVVVNGPAQTPLAVHKNGIGFINVGNGSLPKATILPAATMPAGWQQVNVSLHLPSKYSGPFAFVCATTSPAGVFNTFNAGVPVLKCEGAVVTYWTQTRAMLWDGSLQIFAVRVTSQNVVEVWHNLNRFDAMKQPYSQTWDSATVGSVCKQASFVLHEPTDAELKQAIQYAIAANKIIV